MNEDSPRRRDLLRLLATGGATAFAPTAAGRPVARGTDEPRRREPRRSRTAGSTATESFTGRVQDIEGEPLSGDDRRRVQATAVRVPEDTTEFIDGDGLWSPTQRHWTVSVDGDGTFEIPVGDGGLPVRESDRYVFVYVRAVVDPPSNLRDERRSTEWFAMDRFPVEVFRGGDAQFTVDSRLLTPGDSPVAIWQTVGAGGEIEIAVEARGTYHQRATGAEHAARGTRTAETEIRAETNARSELEMGLFTLQVPEDVTVDYREGQGPKGSPLEPDGYYTDSLDEVDDHVLEELSYLENSVVGRDDQRLPSLRSGRPLFPALRRGPRGLRNDHYQRYDDGSEERKEANRKDLLFDVVNFILVMAGALTGYAIVGVATAVMGASLSKIKKGAIDGPDDLPSWATGGPIYRDGTLAVDHEAYDFVTGQWRWDTFGFVQPFPVTFEGDAPGAFCLRGLYRERTEKSRNAGKEVRRIQQAFVVDPAVSSPLDDDGLRVPDDSFQAAPARIGEPPVPAIDVFADRPEVGESVTFDGTDSETFADFAIESYEWELIPPADPPEQHVDLNGDGTADVVAPDGDGPGIETGSGPRFTATVRAPGTYAVQLTVTDETGSSASVTERFRVVNPPPPEVFPTDADAGENCRQPPGGESLPATGTGAARHFGYGCGDWKVYRVIPGEYYRIAVTVDDCRNCLLTDATFAIEEPEGTLWEPPTEETDWTEVRRQPDPLGRDHDGAPLELSYVPSSRYVRIRNLDGGAGLGFYASVYGPRHEESPGGVASDPTDEDRVPTQ